MDVKYTGDATQLRHFCVIDHDNRKVVLAIRGTFTSSEIIVDIVGYSRKMDGHACVFALLRYLIFFCCHFVVP